MKIPHKSIQPGQNVEAFMASLQDRDIYSDPTTHRLMVKCKDGPIRFPE